MTNSNTHNATQGASAQSAATHTPPTSLLSTERLQQLLDATPEQLIAEKDAILASSRHEFILATEFARSRNPNAIPNRETVNKDADQIVEAYELSTDKGHMLAVHVRETLMGRELAKIAKEEDAGRAGPSNRNDGAGGKGGGSGGTTGMRSGSMGLDRLSL